MQAGTASSGDQYPRHRHAVAGLGLFAST